MHCLPYHWRMLAGGMASLLAATPVLAGRRSRPCLVCSAEGLARGKVEAGCEGICGLRRRCWAEGMAHVEVQITCMPCSGGEQDATCIAWCMGDAPSSRSRIQLQDETVFSRHTVTICAERAYQRGGRAPGRAGGCAPAAAGCGRRAPPRTSPSATVAGASPG